MKKAEIIIGVSYTAKVSGKLVPVKIESVRPDGGWIAINEATGHWIRIRSAARLRRPALADVRVPEHVGEVVAPTDLATPRLAPAQRGIKLAYIAAWRRDQMATNGDPSFTAFWLAHGLCGHCHGIGDYPDPTSCTGKCGDCGGTGLKEGRA